MRAYTVADIFAVAALLQAAIGNGSKLGGLLKADGGGSGEAVIERSRNDESGGERGVALASYLLGECLVNCQELLVSWFASLNGVTADKFKARPPGALLDTIE